ncbi:unnamed protein product [Urochloa humidicola]
MDDFVPCLIPPSLPTEEEEGGLSPRSSVLLDTTAYISAAAVSNATTAIGEMSTGKLVHVSLCLVRPPRLSYLCVHFPGTAAANYFIPSGTPAVRCIKEAPQVISTHADLALLRVPRCQAPWICAIPDATTTSSTRLARAPRSTASRTRTQRAPTSRTTRSPSSAAPAPLDRYLIAGLRNTLDPHKFKLQRYDSGTCSWTSTLLPVHSLERDDVLPIPSTATQLLFQETTKVITLAGPRATIGWVDLWRGILLCDVLDGNPQLRDVPLPKPLRANRSSFCRGSPQRYRDIIVITLPGQQQRSEIKYIEMETRPGEDLPPPWQPPVDFDDDSGSEYDDDEDLDAWF